jgi:ABC-type proline/glycine betaine transport system permease subunit
MNISILGEHLLISIVPWLIGVAVGGGLGYVCALVARGLFSTRPGLRRVALLLPWRSVAVTLASVALLSPAIAILVGIGRVAGMISVGLFVFVFALPFTVNNLLEHWHSSPLAVRLISGARTLATASVAVAVLGAFSGSGGAGVLIFGGITHLDKTQTLKGFSIVALISLIIDVLLGALQMIPYRTVQATSQVAHMEHEA